MKRGIELNMAVGQPATGIGGIFYIILLIGMLFSRLFEKLKLAADQERMRRFVRRLPTFALVLCVMLLVYMNLTGFRFVINAATGTAGSTTQVMDLEILAPFALSFFVAILALFRWKARRGKG